MNNSTTPTKTCTKCGTTYLRTDEFFPRDQRHRDGLQGGCRRCVAATSRAWAKRNKDRMAKNVKAWKKAHPETVRIHEQERREKHRVELRKRARLYRQAHKDEISQKRHAAYRADPEKFLKRAKEWRDRNPKRFQALITKYKARKRHAEGVYTASDIEKIYKLQRGKCWWCGKKLPKRYEIDHRIPLAKGGSNWPNNLVLSCRHCNRSKHDKMPHEFIGRLL